MYQIKSTLLDNELVFHLIIIRMKIKYRSMSKCNKTSQKKSLIQELNMHMSRRLT